MTSPRSVWLFALSGVAFGCASAPPPGAGHVDASAKAAAAASHEVRFHGRVLFDGARFGGGFEDVRPIEQAVHDEIPALNQCFAHSARSTYDLWIVARARPHQPLDQVTSDMHTLDPDAAKCIVDTLTKWTLPVTSPIAVSLALRDEPAPEDCKDPSCTYIIDASVSPPANSNANLGLGSTRPPGALPTANTDPPGGIGLGSIGTNGWGDGLDDSSKGAGRPHTSLLIGDVTVAAGLPVEVVKRIVRTHLARLRDCYETSLAARPGLAGTATLQFNVAPDGSVKQLTVGKSAELSDPSMVKCISDEVNGLAFPRPAGHAVKVVFPILFTPPVRRSVDGLGLADIDGPHVAAHLIARSWRAAVLTNDSDFVVLAAPPSLDFEAIVAIRRAKEALAPMGEDTRVTATSDGVVLTITGHQTGSILDALLDPLPAAPAPTPTESPLQVRQ